ncbi:hypothetical protein GGI42DRAFT_62185 [Trichoderma sp. SZMC 28013]
MKGLHTLMLVLFTVGTKYIFKEACTEYVYSSSLYQRLEMRYGCVHVSQKCAVHVPTTPHDARGLLLPVMQIALTALHIMAECGHYKRRCFIRCVVTYCIAAVGVS